MTIFVQDSFTGSGLLQSHTGEIGATWAQSTVAQNGNATLSGGLLYPSDAGGVAYYDAIGTPPAADYFASSDVTFQSITNTVAVVTIRMVTGQLTHYDFGFDGLAVPQVWTLRRWVNGTSTILQSTTSGLPTVGSTHNLKIEGAGSTITGYLDGVQLLQATDGTITSAGNVGIFAYSPSGSSSTNVFYDNFVAQTTSLTTYAVNDSNLIWSPYNWEFSGSTWAQSNNPGAYCKVSFNGTTLKLLVSVAQLVTQGLSSGDYPTIRYCIDNKTTTDLQLTSSSATITLASGLSSGNHTAQIWFIRTNYNNDRWTTSGYNSVRVTGFQSDGTLISQSSQSKKIAILGDSITEGCLITANSVAGQDAMLSFSHLIGTGLNSEFGVIGFGGQGWTLTGSGSTPTFPNAWNLYRSGVSRSFSPTPDYAIVVHGTNDAINSVSDSTITNAVSAWIASARAAMPSTKIFIVVPPGGFKASAISQGVTNAGDAATYLINLGIEAQRGNTAFALGGSIYSTDGIHPTQWGHSRIAALLVQAIQQKLAARSPKAIRI